MATEVSTQSQSSRDVSVETWRSILADKLGICLSLLCVVHCVLTPVAILLLPSLSYVFHDERVHLALLIILPTTAVFAFVPGYRLHRDRRVFEWGAAGLVLIAAAVLGFHDSIWNEAGISIAGSACLIRAHVINRALCVCCQTGHRPSRLGRFSFLKNKSFRFRTVSPAARPRRLLKSPPPPRKLN